MKKIILGIVSGAIILGAAGTYALAADGEGNGSFNFGQMKPYIEKMHPDLSVQEQKQMFDQCHGNNGMMQNFDIEDMNPGNMMNNL